MEDKKLLQKPKIILISLKTDPNSVLFSEEKLGNRLFKKLKKSKYFKDSELLKLINLADDKNYLDDGKVPTELIMLEKGELIDQLCTVSMVLFNCSMLMKEIWSS